MALTLKRKQAIFNKHLAFQPTLRDWEKLDASQKSLLQGSLEFAADEVPFGGTVNAPNPFLITSHRLIWSSQETYRSLTFDEVVEINAPDWKLDTGDPDAEQKSTLHRLELLSADRSRHLIETLPGSPLFTLWNLLLPLIAGRRKSSTA